MLEQEEEVEVEGRSAIVNSWRPPSRPWLPVNSHSLTAAGESGETHYAPPAVLVLVSIPLLLISM